MTEADRSQLPATTSPQCHSTPLHSVCPRGAPIARRGSHRPSFSQRGPGAATKPDQPHRDREGMCTITMLCVCSPMVATLTPCHKIGCKIVHSVQDFQN